MFDWLPYFKISMIRALSCLRALVRFQDFHRLLAKTCAWQKITFLFLNQNICYGYSKEPSQWDGSFEHLTHMLKLLGKKMFTILYSKFLLSPLQKVGITPAGRWLVGGDSKHTGLYKNCVAEYQYQNFWSSKQWSLQSLQYKVTSCQI